MEKYDYTEDTAVSGFVYDEIGKMHPAELAKIHDAIMRIREEDKKEKEEGILEWFHSTILPMLQEITLSFSGILEVDEDEQEITARFRSEGGIEVDLTKGRMRMALSLADAVSIENMGEEIMFTLIYNKKYLLK